MSNTETEVSTESVEASTNHKSFDYDTNSMNETLKTQHNDISEPNIELDCTSEIPSSNVSTENTNVCDRDNKKTGSVGNVSKIPIPASLNASTIPLPMHSKAGLDFVTEEEIAESLKQKEECDSLLLDDGSCMSGSISQISGSLKTSKFDSSLDALMAKKNQLIDSIKSVLANSSNNLDISLPDNRVNESNTSILSEAELDLKTNHIGTSTPFRESKPPAARFLKKWKPSFSQEEFHVVDEVGCSDDEESGYEKAMASLKEVLSESADTTSKLESYSNMLDAFKEEDAKKYGEMISTIISEKNPSLEECLELEDTTKEVDEFIEEFSERNIGSEVHESASNNTIIIDSKDSTLVPPEEVISISEQSELDETIKAVPDVDNTIITINSSHAESEIVDTEQPQNKNPPIVDLDPNPTENQVVPDDKVPKENDPDILIIGEDDEVEVNVGDEDEELLLAIEDDGKDKQENKVPPQVPLAKDLEVFISSDPDENRDNNDPKWDYLRNLGNDFERYKAVQARWNNLLIPNPKKDLTCRCRHTGTKVNGASLANGDFRPSRKRPHSPDNRYRFTKRVRRESCTILFDRKIDQLAQDVQLRRENLRTEQEQALNQLADIQEMEKLMAKQKGSSEAEMRRLENRHIMETRQCLDEYHMRLNEIMEIAKAKLTALRQASDEVRQFHEFYPNQDAKNGDKNSLVFLSDNEVEEILEVEEMILSFPSFYNA